MKKTPDLNTTDIAAFKASAPIKRVVERLKGLSKDKLIELMISEWWRQEKLNELYTKGIAPSHALRETFSELPYVERPHIKKQIKTKADLGAGRDIKIKKQKAISEENADRLEKAIRDYFAHNGKERKVGNKELESKLKLQFVSENKEERKKQGKYTHNTFCRKVAMIAATIREQKRGL